MRNNLADIVELVSDIEQEYRRLAACPSAFVSFDVGAGVEPQPTILNSLKLPHTTHQLQILVRHKHIALIVELDPIKGMLIEQSSLVF